MNERLVRILARKFANKRIKEEDLFQEGMLAYMKAQMTFNPERGTTLDTYASTVIKNRFIDLIRKEQDTKKLTIDPQDSGFTIEDEMNLAEIKKILFKSVTEIERAIFNSYIEGISYDEIGKIFDKTRKKIDNTVQKVKRIIKSNI
jgi:RNA polymerase sporulation-specific sigma factor